MSYKATYEVKANVSMPSFLQRNWKENCKKWTVAHPSISSLNGALSQIIPAAYMQRGSFRVLWGTEQNIDFIVSMLSQNSVKSPTPEPTSRPQNNWTLSQKWEHHHTLEQVSQICTVIVSTPF